MKRAVVITSIHGDTAAISLLRTLLGDWTIIIVGDRKSRPMPSEGNLIFLSVDDQKALGIPFVEQCPFDHYARKNIGYLFALKNGAEVIYDTDDDNLPYDSWRAPSFIGRRTRQTERRFFNIYAPFSDGLIWPRGFPLDEVSRPPDGSFVQEDTPVAVWQGLADLDPDVDAIHRMLHTEPTRFRPGEPFTLPERTYSPFNSQATFWRREVFALTYLPMTVTFRFTDILRSYVAQRVFWEAGLRLGVLPPIVYQERNVHDLMKDFEDEIPCYLNVRAVAEYLEGLTLRGDMPADLADVYHGLARLGIVSEGELAMVGAWVEAVERLTP